MMKVKAILAAILTLAPYISAQVSPSAPQSRVAGRFVASSYGQWSLPVYSMPSGTGSQTFTLSNATVYLPDGRKIMPFNTNAQIYVGLEVVTVTAVSSNCALDAVAVVGGCAITATFTQQHTASDRISSATFGLQEALNDASKSGGGSVTIDSSWTALGGTTAIKTAAIVPSNAGIEDVSAGGFSVTGSVNGVVNPAKLAGGTNDGGISETYAACPATGCKIALSGNITVSAATTLTPVSGKPLVIDQNGFFIYMSGAGSLTVNCVNSPRQLLVWHDGNIDGANANAGVTGVTVSNCVDVHIDNMHVQNFSKTGSTGAVLNNVEDSEITITTELCFNGVLGQNATNNNKLHLFLNDGGAISGVSLALTGVALTLDNSQANDIFGLIQSNKGTNSLILRNGAGQNKFHKFYVENVGDGTIASVFTKFDSASGGTIVQTQFDGINVTAGPLGALGSEFTTTSVGNIFNIILSGGYHSGFASFTDGTFGTSTTFINQNEDVVDTGGITNATFPPAVVAHLDRTGQTANLASTAIYAVPANAQGFYRLSCHIVITTIATSSTLPACAISSYVDADSGVNNPGLPITFTTTNTGNVIGVTQINGATNNYITFNAKASTSIFVSTSGYVSSPAATMAYAVRFSLEYLGPQ